MSGQLQLRRGTTAQNSTFTGAVGELTYNTDDGGLISHDGVTAGGYPGGGYLAAPGAVVSNVQTKLRETISVKDFGAVGNGVADDTAAFNLAIATGNPVYVPSGTYKTNGAVTSPRRLYTEGADFTGTNTIDPYPAFGEGTTKAFATGNNNCIIGIADNNNPPSTFAFPTGVTGYGRYANAGNTVFGIFGRADAYAAGVACNEFNSFNYAGAPTTALPPNRGSGTTQIVPNALTVAAGGDYPSAIGIQIGQEGSEPQPFLTGIYLNGDGWVDYGIFIDADSSNTGVAFVAKHNTASQCIRAIGVGTPSPNNAWLEYYDGTGTVTFSAKQDGRLTFTTSITQASVGSAGGAAALPANPTGYLKVEISGFIKLIPYYNI
jgi:hypothetical protein